MSRLPTIGSDNGTWGNVLNDFLSQAHDVDGTLKAGAVGSSQIADGAISEAHLDSSTQTKLDDAVRMSQVGAANGVASLDGTARVPIAQIPDLSSLYAAAVPDQVTLTDAATIALNASASDRFYVVLGGNRTLGAPTGTGTLKDGAMFILRARASGADRTLALAAGAGGFVFGAQFTSLPTIVSGTVLVVGCMWNVAGSNWYVTSYASGY